MVDAMTDTPTTTGPVEAEYVLVPREPTPEMLSAADSAIPRFEAEPDGSRLMGVDGALDCWKAMIAAAPTPPAVEAEELAAIINDLRDMTVDAHKGIVPDPDGIADRLSRLPVAAGGGEKNRNPGHVPGLMRCAKCSFRLVRTSLYVSDGSTGPGGNETEPCPNGCGPLWPVTWQERALDAEADLDAAREREAGLREALQWALSEIEGSTRYDAAGQRERCLTRAYDALANRVSA